MAGKKDQDTVVKTADTAAPPLEQADDYAGNREYADNPDKPSPDTVAQIEIVPEKAR